MKDDSKTIGRVRMEVWETKRHLVFWRKKTRLLSDTGFEENLITNAGKAAYAGLVGNVGGITAFSYLAVGTSATAAAVTDTTLTAEITTLGLGRVSGTVSRVTTSVTNDTLQITFTFTATGTATINEAGVLNASSSGILLAHKAPTTATSVVNGNQLILTYQIQFT